MSELVSEVFLAMEMLYQYLWKYRLLNDRLTTVDGRQVEVIYPGRLNSDAGPDFSGARLRIAGQEWCGNVEIHVKASDWFAHHHDRDAAYGNVILHVVGVNDMQIPDGLGGVIPQVVATFPDSFVDMYARLAEKISAVACEEWLKRIHPLVVTDWIESLAVERMQRKSQRILDLLTLVNNDWQRTCFITLARSLGFSLNSEPLEMLARSIPLNVLAHHSDDLMQIEALLFGQAGMLDTSLHIFDEYYQRLCREYFFLARKYGLRPMRSDVWKYARTRPQNFPTRRIALLARALLGGFSLFSKIIDRSCDADSAPDLFSWRLDGYWTDHLDFDRPGTKLAATLSESNVRLLMINFVAPMIYAHGAYHGDYDMAERGLDIWGELDAENNKIMRQWQSAGIRCVSAIDSQALLHLRLEYCDRSRCLQCRFGHTLLRAAANREEKEYLSVAMNMK